jgi:hypothetical protein
MGIEQEVQVKGTHNILSKRIAENFPNLKKKMPFQEWDASRKPNRHDQNTASPQYSVINTNGTENKERILMAKKGKNQLIHKGIPNKRTADFSTET